MNETYYCQQKPSDYIHVEQKASNTGVYLTAYDGRDVAGVDLSRDDALSLAWDIIEHFEEGTRPTPTIKVGDYVKVPSGIVGLVREFSADGLVCVDTPWSNYHWSESTLIPATKQEFIDYYQQKIADIANGQD